MTVEGAELVAQLRGQVAELSQRLSAFARLGLRDPEQLWGALQAAHYGVWEWDIPNNQVYWSDGVETLFGMDPGTFRGTYQAYLELLDPEERARTEKLVADTLESGDSYTIEHRLDTANGVRWLAARGKVFRDDDGQPVRLAGVIGDITERKQTERMLSESEQRFKAFAEATFEGLAFSVDGVVVDANERICEMIGCPPGGLVGRRVADLIPPEDVELVRTNMRRGFEGAYTHRVIGDNGKLIDVEARARMVTYRGQPARITALRDLTEQNRLARDREKLEQELLQAQKMEAVGRLAGGIAHDFNNILTVILGNLELAQDTDAEQPHDRASYLIEAQNSAEKAAALTAQLLTFSREQPPHPKRVALSEVLGDVRRMIQRLLRENIQLHITEERELRAVLVDPGQLQQVIINLVVNAQDAMPHGGELHIRTSNVHLQRGDSKLHPTQAGTFVRLEVEDTGIGMLPETRKRIFEPFFTTKEAGHGTGLGLSTAADIIRRTHGSIAAESQHGKGTRIEILLPAQSQPPLPLYERPKPHRLLEGHETLLICEDELHVRTLMARILRSAGYAVLEAGDAQSAVELAQTMGKLDLLITDVVLPGMDGKRLADLVHTMHGMARVLFCTGYANGVLEEQQLVHSDLLPKPFTREALLDKVRQVLDAPLALA